MMKAENLKMVLWGVAGALLLGLLALQIWVPDVTWATLAALVALVGVLGTQLYQYRKSLTTRAAAYGLNSAVTVLLVLAIVGVINFLSNRYPYKKDLTKAQVHTLSDQTLKIVKGLQKDVKATVFAKFGQQEQVRPLLDNYKGLNPKFQIEYIDPDKEPTRAKQAGIKKYGTLRLEIGERSANIDDPNEEKVTNELIKLTQEKKQKLCALTGHGEKSFSSNEADGYQAVKNELQDQAYEIEDLDLIQKGEIPADCAAVAVLGPTKSLFEKEVSILSDFLEKGGKALFALDLNLNGSAYAVELTELLKKWHIKIAQNLIVDPLSRLLGVEAAVPILATFSKEHSITKDFQGQCFFPFAQPLEIMGGASPDFDIQWLAKTTPKSWGEASLSELGQGRVSFNAGADSQGPLVTAVALERKKKDADVEKKTRIAVFGTSQFAANNYSRFGGNLDFFLNTVSWLLEDENLISIRARDEEASDLIISVPAGKTIFWMTVVIMPMFVAIAGVVIWARRKRL